jgi:hypothetical protein
MSVCVIHMHWSHFVQHTLGAPPVDSDFPGPSKVYDLSLKWFTDNMITAHTTDTITAQTAKTRIISTYIQQIWHGKIGQIHPILDQADLSFDTYMNCIRYRTMNIPAPVYIMPRSRHKIPYMERRCKFGCLDPADIFHVLLHCPHTTHHIHNTLYPPPTNPIDIFDDKTYDMRIVATVIHNLMTLLHAQSIDNHEQPISQP